jgi:20S proteasome alpha/beta subunit
VTLTGSVEDQYQQWRELLRQIYEAEVGHPIPVQQGGES